MTKIKKYKNHKKIVFFTLIIAIFFVSNTCKVFADQTKTVKVGWFILSGFQEVDKSGNYSGYNYDYLRKIEQNTNLKFEFVEGRWSTLIKKLELGEIDLMGNVSKTNERLNKLEYSESPMGKSNIVFVVRQNDKRFNFNDYKTFDGKNVSYITGDFRNNQVLKLENEFDFKTHHYICNSSDEVLDKLDKGKVDIAIIDSVTKYSGYKIVGEYDSQPYFYVTKKGNKQLIKEIDFGLESIRINNASFNSDLIKRHQGGKNEIAYTKEERDILEENKIFKVGIPLNSEKGIYDNGNKVSIYNIDKVLFEKIGKDTGLKFEFVPIKIGKTPEQGLIDGDYNLVAGIENNIHNQNNFKLTDSYMPNDLLLFENFRMDKNKADNFLVGISKINECKIRSIKKQYPNWEFTILKEEDLIKKIDSKKIDGAIINKISADYYKQQPKYKQLMISTTDLDIEKNCIAISENIDKKVVNILNKSLKKFDKLEMETQLRNYMLKNRYKYSATDFIRENIITFLNLFLGIILIVAIVLRRSNKALNKAKNEADEANFIKTDFLSRMSHDMRTPLVAVLGLSDIGIDENRDNTDTVYFKQIKRSATYLLALLNDILDFQKIESQKVKLRYEVCNMEHIVDNIINIVKPRAGVKNIDLVLDIDFKINNEPVLYQNIDTIRFCQIMINLLNNAIKYTQSGGRVVWRGFYKKIGNKYFYFCDIEDNGVGMSEKFQKRIFEPFHQEVNSETKNEMGTGLGLAITKNLLDLMGGNIDCISKLEEGTKFTFKIPVKFASKKEIQSYSKVNTKKDKQHDLKNKKVLVCEDVRLNAVVVSKILKSKGMRVDFAENGLIAIEKVKNNNYDVVLMDIRMPIVDGIEATKKIRTFNLDVIIIALSANAYEEDINKSINAGMNAHLSKPIEKDVLFETLQKFL